MVERLLRCAYTRSPYLPTFYGVGANLVVVVGYVPLYLHLLHTRCLRVYILRILHHLLMSFILHLLHDAPRWFYRPVLFPHTCFHCICRVVVVPVLFIRYYIYLSFGWHSTHVITIILRCIAFIPHLPGDRYVVVVVPHCISPGVPSTLIRSFSFVYFTFALPLYSFHCTHRLPSFARISSTTSTFLSLSVRSRYYVVVGQWRWSLGWWWWWWWWLVLFVRWHSFIWHCSGRWWWWVICSFRSILFTINLLSTLYIMPIVIYCWPIVCPC